MGGAAGADVREVEAGPEVVVGVMTGGVVPGGAAAEVVAGAVAGAGTAGLVRYLHSFCQCFIAVEFALMECLCLAFDREIAIAIIGTTESVIFMEIGTTLVTVVPPQGSKVSCHSRNSKKYSFLPLQLTSYTCHKIFYTLTTGRFDHGPPRPGFFDPPHGGPYFDNFPPQPDRRPGGRATRRDDGPPGVSLLVRNISPEVKASELQAAFGRIGEVRDVYIPRDFHSQQPRGFAFIEYATAEMAREAREEMNKFLMKGMELEVVYAQEKRKTPNEMRGRVVDGRGVVARKDGRGDGFQRSSSFERHKRRERERENR